MGKTHIKPSLLRESSEVGWGILTQPTRSFVEKTITPEELMLVDEIFLTNALMGVKKVCQLNHRIFNSSEVSNSLQSALQEKKNYV